MRRILIVDDAKDSCIPLARLLRHSGYDAECIESGAAALSLLEREPADLVLLDVMMPEMNGLQVLERIRSDRKTAGLPVVMFTASNDESTRAQAQLLGATDYWLKGNFDFNSLHGLIAIRKRTRSIFIIGPGPFFMDGPLVR